MEAERLAGFEKLLESARVVLTSGIAEITLGSDIIPRSTILQDLWKIPPRLSAIPDIVVLPDVVKVLTEPEDVRLIGGK